MNQLETWDKITLQQMSFYGYHGALIEENRLGQSFVVDLELYLDLRPAGLSDDLEQTVNYAEVYETVRQEVEETQVKLIERLAHNIADQCLQQFAISATRVRVTKVNPPIPKHFGSVEVEIWRCSER